MVDDNVRLLEELNSVVVTVQELSETLHELEEEHDRGTAEEGDGICSVVSKFADQSERAQAIYFRMVALANIITRKGAHGWTMPSHKSGAVLTKSELIETAATYPLSVIDGRVGFEVNGFLSKALESAEAEGTS
jgi:formylmethanofuran dehydrogenase subunit D